MLELIIFLVVTQVYAGPIEDGLPNVRSSGALTTEEPCHCPSPAKSSAQTKPSNDANQHLSLAASSPHFNSIQNLVFHGTPCVCSIAPFRKPIRDDYRYTPGIGSHKFHTRALPWNEARKICNEEGGHLAVINSAAEAQVAIEMFNTSGPIKNAAYDYVAFVGIHDLYKEGEWVTISGESIARTGYTKWTDKWGGQPDNGDGKQHCGAFFKEGGLDDVSCEAAFAYICELPIIQIFK